VTGAHISAVVLAAGLSSRMPGNKLLVSLAGKPVVRHVVEAAAASRASSVLVVTGNAAAEVKAALAGLNIRFVENKDFARGLGESLKCGVRSAPADCDGVLVLLGDMPFITPALIDNLISAFEPERGWEICLPIRDGRRGNPVLWGRRFFPELLTLTGDKGAKGLMDLHADAVCELEVDDDASLIDIDTAEDLQRHQP
jgi:molybdenum cofactor cytidylyltransferase